MGSERDSGTQGTIGAGRAIGAAMLCGALIDGWSNFGLQSRLFDGGGFLANAGGQPFAVGSIVVLGLVACLLSLWAATLLTEWQDGSSPVLSRVYFALVAVALATTLVELSTLIAMRELSALFVAAPPDDVSRFETARALVRGLRNGLHFSTKALQGATLIVFYALLFKTRAVPRLIAGAGMLAAPLQLVVVGAPLFGREGVDELLAPIALVYLSTAAWLLFRGLPRAPTSALVPVALER